MKIAFIGYGNVGAPLADHLQRLGHDVTLAAKDRGSASVERALGLNAALKVASPADAVKDGAILFLATPYEANEAAPTAVADAIEGKIIVDCTNPAGADLSHGLDSVGSGAEAVQQLAPQSRVVKAFTIDGFENFENSAYPGYNVKPVMMYCGDDTAAKDTIGELIAQLGWERPMWAGLNRHSPWNI